MVGFAVGLETIEELKPVVGLQLYVVAPLTDNVVEVPEQIVAGGLIVIVGVGVTVITIESFPLQTPFEPVTV